MMEGDLTFESAAQAPRSFHGLFGLQETQEEPLFTSEIRRHPVLVVEDTETSRELLETFLGSWSIPCTSVAIAEEGVAPGRSTTGRRPDPFGLVLWTGCRRDERTEAASRIREKEETRSLPIVLISAYAGKEEEARCAEVGVNVFLEKPITASSLFNALVEAQGLQVQIPRHVSDTILENEFEGTVALLAEDNDANQMVATELLSRLGIELDIANNGREAVEMARDNKGRYAAILMDMQMPEMDGLEATRTLRADPEFRDIPIIAMTANAMRHDMDACLAAGMNDHVLKPIDRSALVQTLRRWLPRRAPALSSSTTVSVEKAATRSHAGPAAEDTASGLYSLEGIDVKGTLRRLALPFESLRKMLIRFADGQRRTRRTRA
jgi:CheY-like chemotaxis protein